jgi:hypothetical protein
VFSIGDDTRLGFSQLGIWPNKLCKSTKDPVCDFKNAIWGTDSTIQASALLNVCTTSENEDCIESIEISRDGATFSQLKFERYVVGGTCDSSASAGCAFPPDPEMRLPRGGNLSIWSEIVDGKVEEGGKQRTRSKALAFLLEKVREAGPIENLAVLQANCDDFEAFVESLRSVYSGEIIVGDIGPIIGTHTGAGTIGVAFHTKP